jgi:putative membrane protein
MDEGTKTKPAPDSREILAAERTFLAWIRTGIALMGFGFVVARFGIFLREVQVARLLPEAPTSDVSLWFGTALIALGVIVNLLAAGKHIQLARQLERGELAKSRPSTLAVFIALFLALFGLAVGIYLISVRTSATNHSGNSGVSMAPATAGRMRGDNA